MAIAGNNSKDESFDLIQNLTIECLSECCDGMDIYYWILVLYTGFRCHHCIRYWFSSHADHV